MRGAFTFLLTLAFVAMPAAAVHPADRDVHGDPVLEAAPVFEAFSRLLRMAPTSPGVEANASVSVPLMLDAQAFGDLDADGHVDLAVLRMDLEAGAEIDFPMRLEVRSGADLRKVLLSREATEEALAVLPDLDGDGIAEIGRVTGAGSGTGRGVPTPLLGAQDYQVAFTGKVEIRSGATDVRLLELSDSLVIRDTMAYGPVAGANRASFRFQSDLALSALESFRDDITLNATAAYGATGSAYAHQAFGAPAIVGADGTIQASFRTPRGGIFDFAWPGTFDADASADLVVSWREPLAPADGMLCSILVCRQAPQSSILHVAAVTKAGIQWDFQLPRGGHIMAEAVALPDLTGDGLSEVEALVATVDVQGRLAFRTVLLDGATGALLHEVTDGIGIFVPMGNVTGDGVTELIQVSGDLAAFESGVGLTWSVVDASFNVLWSIEADGFPVNFAATTAYTTLGGMTDLTGDALPDLAFEVYTEHGAIELTVHDGVTGARLWSQALNDTIQVRFVADVTGRGGQDLVVLRLEGAHHGMEVVAQAGTSSPQPAPAKVGGFANATLRLQVLHGLDGALLVEQVLRGPSLPTEALHGLHAYAHDVGDLTADGRAEIAVIVYEGIEVVIDGDTHHIERPVAYILDLTEDEPLLVVGGNVTAGASAELPEPVRTQAWRDATASAGRDAGSPMVALLLAGLAVVALRRR